jgi:hypothetical protein
MIFTCNSSAEKVCKQTDAGRLIGHRFSATAPNGSLLNQTAEPCKEQPVMAAG